MPIAVYPNPSNDKVYINLSENLTENLNIRLYNLSGEEVLNVYNGSYQSNLSFSSNELTNGVYILRIISGNTILSQKIVVNK